jgi:CHRD domain
MRCRVLLAVMGSLLALATVAKADQIGALLTGYEESPSVSTAGSGEFTATVAPDGEAIEYTETYSGLQGTVTQSHIHVGQLGVNGSIVIFLCQTAANPDPTGLAPECPQEGTVSGTITTANVIAGETASQQLAAGDLAAVVAAIEAGAAYANVHTDVSPGGEIRGQIRTIARGG